jgi:hypothetical protein
LQIRGILQCGLETFDALRIVQGHYSGRLIVAANWAHSFSVG